MTYFVQFTIIRLVYLTGLPSLLMTCSLYLKQVGLAAPLVLLNARPKWA